jgi:hypothetical protein
MKIKCSDGLIMGGKIAMHGRCVAVGKKNLYNENI